MLSLAEGREVVIICGATDMRKQIDGLCYIVKSCYDLDPCSGALFLFCGRRKDRIRMLYFDDKRGFVLLYLRLETGGRFQWPRNEEEARTITTEQYRRLLDGLQIEETSTLGSITRTDIL